MQGTGPGRTAGLTGDGDPLRVAAEGGNILFYPLAGFAHIVQGIVAGSAAALFCQIRVGEEAQEAQTVVDGHNNNILPSGKACAVADHLAAASGHHAAAVNPDEYRQLVLRGLGGGPHIQIQTVLLILGGSQELGNAMNIGRGFGHLHDMLYGSGGISRRLPDAPPAAGILRLAEAILTDGGRRIRDALEHLQSSVCVTLQPALTDLYSGSIK